jgi:multiple sugar transport system permease protein
MRNDDISFFFLSQLILPPVVLALPFLVLYKAGPARHADRADPALHADGAADRHLDHARPVRIIPTELEEAALVDGLSIWGAFVTIILPIALPGMVAAFILSLVLTWNEYFFAALLTSTDANTLPVMVASPDRQRRGSTGGRWRRFFAAILPLIVIGIVLERYIIKGMAAGAVKFFRGQAYGLSAARPHPNSRAMSLVCS